MVRISDFVGLREEFLDSAIQHSILVRRHLLQGLDKAVAPMEDSPMGGFWGASVRSWRTETGQYFASNSYCHRVGLHRAIGKQHQGVAYVLVRHQPCYLEA